MNKHYAMPVPAEFLGDPSVQEYAITPIDKWLLFRSLSLPTVPHPQAFTNWGGLLRPIGPCTTEEARLLFEADGFEWLAEPKFTRALLLTAGGRHYAVVFPDPPDSVRSIFATEEELRAYLLTLGHVVETEGGFTVLSAEDHKKYLEAL